MKSTQVGAVSIATELVVRWCALRTFVAREQAEHTERPCDLDSARVRRGKMGSVAQHVCKELAHTHIMCSMPAVSPSPS